MKKHTIMIVQICFDSQTTKLFIAAVPLKIAICGYGNNKMASIYIDIIKPVALT